MTLQLQVHAVLAAVSLFHIIFLGWRLCDDSHVTKSSENQVGTRAAYVLFYRRRDMHLPLPEPCNISENLKEAEDSKTDELLEEEQTTRPVFTISPDQETPENDSGKKESLNIFGTEFMFEPSNLRPRSFSFSEGDRRSHNRGGGGDSTSDNKYIDTELLKQPSCTDMDSVD